MNSQESFPDTVDPTTLVRIKATELRAGDQIGNTGWYITETHDIPPKYHDKFLKLYNDLQVEDNGICHELAHWRLWDFTQKLLKLDPLEAWSFRIQAGHKITVFGRGHIEGMKPEEKDPHDFLAGLGIPGLSGKTPFEVRGIRAGR